MSENKTSKAMAELPDFMDHLAKIKVWSYDVDPAGPKVARALAAKYQRMNEALQKVAGGGCPSGECSAADIRYGECYCAPRIAQEALDFDPLSQQDK